MNQDEIEVCRCSNNGKCNYFDDSDLECDGTENERNNCAAHVGYSSELR